MTVTAYKTWYVYCDECQWGEYTYSKKERDRHAANHDCAKALKRRLANGNPAILERFAVEIVRTR